MIFQIFQIFPWETIAFPCVSPKKHSFSMSLSWNLPIKWQVFSPKKNIPSCPFFEGNDFQLRSSFHLFFAKFTEMILLVDLPLGDAIISEVSRRSCQPSSHRKSSKKRCWTSVGSRSSLKFHRALAGHGKITGFCCDENADVRSKSISKWWVK